MKRNLAILFALICWFAVITQYVLMMENRVTLPLETTIRFFSFFTILTNILVAFYFTLTVFHHDKPERRFNSPGFLTAVAVYITIVGLVYQIVLRSMFKPAGLDFLVNELLHSVIPLIVIGFWYFYENTSSVNYSQIAKWMIYPLVYLIYILSRGSFSDYYPYPFVNVLNIGLQKVLLNSGILMFVFIGVSFAFVFVGKRFGRNRKQVSELGKFE